MKSKLLILIFGMFLITCTSAIDFNITFTQQSQICSDLNFSYIECYQFWSVFDNCTYCEDQIIYKNVTQNNTIYLDNCSIDSLEMIDNYAERGFEPIFVDGKITNWKKIEDQVCDLDCSQEIIKALQQQEPSSLNPSSNTEDNTILIVLGIMIIVFIIGFIAMKFYKKTSSIPITPESYNQVFSPPVNSGLYDSPSPLISPKPQEQKKQEFKDASKF